MVMTSYGRSSGFCIDPIEKKPLNHFLPGSPVLSFGTAGCNLACKFCQNWDISKSREIDTLADAASPEVIARAAQATGCRSVAFTYNDPVIFLEYALDIAAACREAGIGTVAVTAGYICEEPRVGFYRAMDAANVDLKAFSEDFYRKICGAELARVLETLVYLKHETDVWFELTTLLIPGENDSDAELDAMTRWVVDNLGADVPMHFTAFHRLPPRLEDARASLDPARNPYPCAAHRHAQRRALRLYGQRPRYGRRFHLLPWLRRYAHRARLVHTRRLEPDRRRPLRPLRDPARRPVRRARRQLGCAPRADPLGRLRRGGKTDAGNFLVIQFDDESLALGCDLDHGVLVVGRAEKDRGVVREAVAFDGQADEVGVELVVRVLVVEHGDGVTAGRPGSSPLVTPSAARKVAVAMLWPSSRKLSALS